MPQTQVKQIRGYILKIREDLIINSAFAQILTDQTLIEVKLPTKVENYRYRSVLNFGNLLALDLVKTRKHWIVTHIECHHKPDFSRWNYSKFENLSLMNQFLVDNLHLDQDCSILECVHSYILVLEQTSLDGDINHLMLSFQDRIQAQLGFSSGTLI